MFNQGAMIGNRTGTGRVLQQQAEVAVQVLALQPRFVTDDHVDTQWLGTGTQDVEGLRVAMLGGEERRGLVLRQPLAEGHGLGGGGGFIEQRRVGDLHAGQVADQGLEVQQRFQPALGDLRLVRGVRGVPGRILQQIAQDRRGGVARVVTLADMVAKQLVLAGDGLERGQRLRFALPFAQLKYTGALDAVGDHVVDQRFEGVVAGERQHGIDVAFARADVAGDEFVGGAQRDGCVGHVDPPAQALSAR
ncbi:hypothetical protein D3C76_852510 [compost metagenome]